MTKKIILLFAMATLFSIAASAQNRSRRAPIKRAPVVAALSTGAVKTASGLTFITTQPGTGRMPKAGETVVVNYTGTLTNGKKFDSSLDPGRTPIEFPIGRGRVIKGWDEGIAKLRVGGRAILIIPAAIGYGVRGTRDGAIPPDATLVFVVELVDIKTP